MSLATPTILSNGQAVDQSFALLGIDITKELNRIPYARLTFIDGDAAQRTFAVSNSGCFAPGREIEIRLRYEGVAGSDRTLFKGLVVRQSVAIDARLGTLTVEMKDAAVKLTQGRQNRVFRDQTDNQILAKLIRDGGLRVGTIAPTRTRHGQMVQYYTSDWDFILLRAQCNGLLVNADDGAISVAAITTGGPVKHRCDFGLDEVYELEMTADGGEQQRGVQAVAWDPGKQEATKAVMGKGFNLAQGNLDGAKVAGLLGGTAQTLASFTPLAPGELQAWADGALARNRLGLLRGRVSMPGSGAVKPLDRLEITGVGERFNGATLITGVRHRYGLHGWSTDIQFGLDPAGVGDPRAFGGPAAAGLLPGIGGLQLGVVAAFEEDPDKELRVRVRVPGVGTDHAGVLWARLATPDAGKDRGYFFRPEPGDEVVVGFFNDDPRQAVILGALYSAKNSPPAKLGKPAQENSQRAIVTRKGTSVTFDDAKGSVSITTPKANTILLDDDAGKIAITDQHGNSICLGADGILIKSAKDLTFEAAGKVEIKGTKVDIK